MIKDLAREVGVGIKALGWRFRKWGVRTRRSYEYGEVIAVLNSISKQRGVEAKKNYLENYKNGKIAWQQAHKMARYVWGITDKPCQACGWDRAERDMHLIEPRLLVKENAVSLCPNCHRLWHGGLINKSHLKI